jgi:hypothetical protein
LFSGATLCLWVSLNRVGFVVRQADILRPISL